MRQKSQEIVEHHACPKAIARRLRIAGGVNRYGEANFRVVWGYNRIVPMTGEWQEFEHGVATLTDKVTGYAESRPYVKLVRSVVETRLVPKYLPANAWHLEMWRPPEEYGRPQDWRKRGEEVIQGLTVDTAGEYPERGEWELCYPLTDDGTSRGRPLPLAADVVEEIVQMVRVSKERFSFQQRKAAIEQRLVREEDGFTRKNVDMLKDGLRPFAGEQFVTVPKMIQ